MLRGVLKKHALFKKRIRNIFNKGKYLIFNKGIFFLKEKKAEIDASFEKV